MKQIRILLADDHNVMRKGLRLLLESQGDFSVVGEAADGRQAVAKAEETKPDVVVLDISLPAGDGFLVAERLQTLAGSAATPIIFMTASENPGLRERAMKLGAVGFLKKPFDATSLADAIESALSPGDNWRSSIAN